MKVAERTYLFGYLFQDEQWRPTNLQNKKECEKFVEDMKGSGFDIKSYIFGEHAGLIGFFWVFYFNHIGLGLAFNN